MKANTNDIVFDTIKLLLLLFLTVITIGPFLNVLAISLNNAEDASRGGIGLWPRQFDLANYQNILSIESLPIYTLNSVGRTVISGLLHIFCNAMVAYTLTRKKYVFRLPITFLYLITMYVEAGLIPNYFLIKNLGLINTFTVYWITGITHAWNIIVIRTYIKGLPESLTESAQLEGAHDFYIFMRIIIPLCMPVLATLILFTAVYHWNAWFDTYLYNSNNDLSTLQHELMRKVLSASQAVSQNYDPNRPPPSPRTIRAAMTIVVSLPIILVYPFLQRYFVHGLTIGGVKE